MQMQIKVSGRKILDTRHPQHVERLLLAPGELDHLNHMTVALSIDAYIRNMADGSIAQLSQVDSKDKYISLVTWIKQGKVLAVSHSSVQVQPWDAGHNLQTDEKHGWSHRQVSS